MLFFALLVVVLFSIAFDPRGAFSPQIAGGVLCVATMFASVSALNQAWAREIRHQVMDAQRMAPSSGRATLSGQGHRQLSLRHHRADRPGPGLLVMYNLRVAGQCMAARPGAAAGHLGTGRQRNLLRRTLHSQPQPRTAAAADSVSHLSCPHCSAMVRPPDSILTGDSDPSLWIKMLVGYDIIFTTVSLLLFDVVFHAE